MNLKEQLALKLAEAKAAYEAGDVTKGDTLKAEAETLQKAIKGMASLGEIEDATKSATPMRPAMPGSGNGTQPEQPDNGNAAAEAAKAEAVKAVYTLRFGDEDAAQKTIMADLVGLNYRQLMYDQEIAFAKYVRFGERRLDREEQKLLDMQIFPFADIKMMVQGGIAVSTIKATMVEAQGELGGYAVPVTMQAEVIRRLPGLTVVRGGGATVVNLTTGYSTEILEVTGADSDHRYTGNLRGKWGAETQAPTEENLTFASRLLVADLYTYKVPMSRSLLEDASNVVSILQDEIMTTMAIDEDEVFLIGNGVGKPLGFLPGGANTLSLREVNSGHASAITATGIKRLKRGIPVQYRAGARFVANSATYGEIETLVDGVGRYLFEDLTETDRLLNRTAAESEVMPDIGANTFPVLWANMAAYYIVERSGMTVERMMDSGTGPNKVEFHTRRRVGGRPVKTWMASLLKIAA